MRRASFFWWVGMSYGFCASCTLRVESTDGAEAFSGGGPSKGGSRPSGVGKSGPAPADNLCDFAFAADSAGGSGGGSGSGGAAGAASAWPENSPLGCSRTEPELGAACDWSLVACNYGTCLVNEPARTYICCAGVWKRLTTNCD